MPTPIEGRVRVGKNVKANIGNYESAGEDYTLEMMWDVSDLPDEEAVTAFLEGERQRMSSELDKVVLDFYLANSAHSPNKPPEPF